MEITVIGTGYVGLVQGVCLADLGNNVTCVDIDVKKVEKLNQGISPIYEPGIEEMIKSNLRAGRIKFTTSLKESLNKSEIAFIAVGTPPDETGRANLKYVLAAAEEIGKNLKSYKVIVNKSTVPIGTGKLVKQTISKFYSGEFDVVSNPEFLREGSAIDDWLHPDRVIIGDSSRKKAAGKVSKLYEVLGSPILITDLETAEMIKYASNSFLATQISFINSLANVCEKVGADVNEVAHGMKLDKRIGKWAFLNAGLGYGGSCFPKDVEELIQISRDNNFDFKILEEVEAINQLQRQKFLQKIKNVIGDVKGKTIAVWGIAFKPKTDDIRMAPSVTIIEKLQSSGAKIVAFDQAAEKNIKNVLPKIKFATSAINACKGADALVIITEWDEFKQIDFKKIKLIMKNPIIIDGRNIFSPSHMKEKGFIYHSIGRKYYQ